MEDSNQPSPSSEDYQNDKHTKITDFNDHILWKFWDYLDLIDLANVSDAIEQLMPSTKTYFSVVYKNTRFDLSHLRDGIRLSCFEKRIYFENNRRGRIDLHSFIKKFGDCLTHIRIIQSPNGYSCREYMACTGQIIGNYFSKNLLKLELYGKMFVCNCFSEHTPLMGLQKLSIANIMTIHGTLAFDSINKSYPNLRSLEFHNIRRINERFSLNLRLPHLEHFGMYFYIYAEFDAKCAQFLRSILSLNPQIRSLGMDRIERLYDEFSLIDFSNIEDIEINGRLDFISLPNLQNLISLTTICPIDLRCRNIPVTLRKLKIHLLQFDYKISNIVQHCYNLTSLRISTCERFDLECVEGIAKNLTQLEEFTVISFRINDDTMDSTMNLCFSVLILFIENCNRLRIANALSKLNSEEKIVIRDRRFTTLNSRKYLSKFRDIMKKSLKIVDWQWFMMYEVRHIDLEKYRTWVDNKYLCIELENQTRIEE